jgi:hypothetical protein
MARKSKAQLYAEKLKMPEKPKGIVGRPSYRYDAKKAFEFIGLLAEGQLSIRAICEKPDMPTRATIFTWVRENPEFAALYHEARALQVHGYVDDTVYIADTEKDTSKARVRIDARRWLAERLDPKNYGNRIEHEHTAQITTTNVNLLEKLTETERDELRELIMRAQSREETERQLLLEQG